MYAAHHRPRSGPRTRTSAAVADHGRGPGRRRGPGRGLPPPTRITDTVTDAVADHGRGPRRGSLTWITVPAPVV